MNNGFLVVLGLGAVAAAVVIATKKKDVETTRVRLGPNDVRFTSPGLPPIRYNPNVRTVSFNGQ